LPTLLLTSTKQNSSIAHKEALSYWRVLTSYLRPSTADQTYLRHREATIAAAASAFSAAFAPWATNPSDRERRYTNLADIMRNAADIGTLLFAQPSTFDFRWARSSGKPAVRYGKNASQLQTPQSPAAGGAAEPLVVAPALLKTSDHWGVPLSRPQVMVEETVLEL
jgi:hypothetical protein